MQVMLDAIKRDALDTVSYTGQTEISAPVLNAMAHVRRENFVPPERAHLAYFNRPLQIGHGQTISQPFIVALMTDLLHPQSAHRILEIGTGSGYQAAVLAKLAAEIYTIEIVDALARQASERLVRLGYDNVRVQSGDGWHGWPEAAPFDGIIVTAVAEEIPPKLLQQLKPGGRMVLPIKVGPGHEELAVVNKSLDGKVTQRNVLPVRFVPLTRQQAQDK
jgi:protein-L-isoaspartate(D-aspartate) O-methyltransferase